MKSGHKEKELNHFFIRVVNRFLGNRKRTQRVEQTGYIKIKKVNFPDRHFRQYIKENFDKDGDGILSSDEINSITRINLYYTEKTSNLKGMEYFPNLTYLACGGESITSLDVSENKELKELFFPKTDIISLDVSKNTVLETLFCLGSKIKKLDISQNQKLKRLECSYTGITELDLSQNIELDKLSCYKTEITELDISNNKKLEYLGCSCTGIKELDISQNNKLEVLHCSGTGIKELDVSQNKELHTLWCNDTGVASLDLSQNQKLVDLDIQDTNLSWLHIGENPNLSIEKSESTIDLGSIGKTFNIEEVFPGIDPSRITSINGATLDKEKGIVSGYVNGSTIKYTYDCGTSKNGTESLDVTLTL